MSRLAPILQRYFTGYALTQRALSPATIRTYRDSWALLLTFVSERTQLPPYALELAHVDCGCVTAFLDHLENERGNSIATRNLRLAAIKAVLTFHCASRPEHLDTIATVQAIPVKKKPRPHLTYLTTTQVQALLDAIDTTTWTGRRDQAMFALAAKPACGSANSSP
jgi:integrase/recombinase XerD